MSLFSIISIDNEFSNIIASESLIDSSRVKSFLDFILHVLETPQDVRNIERILQIFRKWRVLYQQMFDSVYGKEIPKIQATTNSIYLPIMTIPTHDEALNAVNQIRESSFYETLVKSVDPYGSSIKLLNGNRKEDKHIHYVAIIQQAIDHFKDGEIQQSLTLYMKVMQQMKHHDVDNILTYLFSWILHGIGNIFFVCSQYSSALDYYKGSIVLKDRIPYLPKAFMFQSQLKEISCRMMLNTEDNIPDEFSKLSKQIESHREDMMRFNKGLYSNMIIDLNYYRAIYAFNQGHNRQALHSIKKVIEIAEEVDDENAILNCNILKAAHSPKNKKYIAEISAVLASLPESKRKNPYIRRLASSEFISLVNTRAPELGTSLTQAFKKCGIVPLQYCPIDQTTVKMFDKSHQKCLDNNQGVFRPKK